MCPDLELNLQHFGVRGDAPTNWATQPASPIISWSPSAVTCQDLFLPKKVEMINTLLSRDSHLMGEKPYVQIITIQSQWCRRCFGSTEEAWSSWEAQGGHHIWTGSGKSRKSLLDRKVKAGCQTEEFHTQRQGLQRGMVSLEIECTHWMYSSI